MLLASLAHPQVLGNLSVHQSSSSLCVKRACFTGIGRITSIALSQAGWNVVLFARRADELRIAATECPGKTLVVPGDVANEADVVRLFAEAVKAFGA